MEILDCCWANALAQNFEEAGVSYVVPPQSIRATVIGAGMHVLQLTGSTISVDPSDLPLKNVPLIKITIDGDCFESENLTCRSNNLEHLEERVLAQMHASDLDWTAIFALHIEGLQRCNFDTAKSITGGLASMLRKHCACQPFVIALSSDFAAALGMLLRKHLSSEKIIVIDGIEASDGDFIDIGLPLIYSRQGLSSIALPVVVKSLVFLN